MLHECSRIVDFENSERPMGKVENVMPSFNEMGINSFAPRNFAEKATANQKSVCRSYNGLLMQLQNIGFRISGMCRKQTFSS